MAVEIITEVWQHAPETVKGNELLVLLRMANSATVDYRMCWLSVARIAREIHASERSVYDVIENLERRGIIRKATKDEIPPAATRFKSTVRVINPVEQWSADFVDDEEPEGEANPEETSPENFAGVQNLQSNPEKSAPKTKETSPTEMSHTKENTLRVFSTVQRAPLHRTNTPQKKKIFKGREEDLDVFDSAANAIEDEPQLPPAPKKITGMGLAERFATGIARNAPPGWAKVESLGVINKRAFAKAVNQWIKEGTPATDVLAMVDRYVTDPDYWDDSKPLWIDFLGKRFRLMRAVNGSLISRIGEHEPFTDENGEFDVDAWLRAQEKRSG